MINFLLIALAVVIFMLVLRWAVHTYFPSYGTIWANLITGAGLFIPEALNFIAGLLADAQALPWSSILDASRAQAVVFGILVSNMIMRKLGLKGKV
jgi:hypothetical protein